MKTLFFTLLLIVPFLGFAQVDLTKKQAFERFKKSESRKSLNIEIKEFNLFYTQAKCISENWDIKLYDMPIFKEKTTEFIDNGQFRQSLFGLGDTIFPKFDDKGKKTITCGAFATN